MEPTYRYFKCSLDVEPIKTLNENWIRKREERDAKLVPIFDSIPFYNFWSGNNESIFGIMCNRSDPEFLKIAEDSESYHIFLSKNGKMATIVGNESSEIGRKLNKSIGKASKIMQKYPSYSHFMLKKLRLIYSVGNGNGRVEFISTCGVAENHLFVAIPVKSNDFNEGKKFPSIPDYLIEIKQDEYTEMRQKSKHYAPF